MITLLRPLCIIKKTTFLLYFHLSHYQVINFFDHIILTFIYKKDTWLIKKDKTTMIRKLHMWLFEPTRICQPSVELMKMLKPLYIALYIALMHDFEHVNIKWTILALSISSKIDHSCKTLSTYFIFCTGKIRRNN